MGRLTDKVAIVTGGARGIGRCIVETFLREGAKVYSFDMAEGGYSNPNLKHIVVSVTDFEKLGQEVEKIKAEAGKIDILVNNAGVTKDALVVKMDEKMWDFVIDVNLKGTFLLTKIVSPLMMEAGKGAIVNISSIVGEYGNVGQTNYSATKAGVIGMTKTWAKEFTRKGAAVRTNAVAPGYVATEMVLTVPEKVLDGIKAKNPLGRLGEPQEIADAVLFLASDEASFVNGHVLSVNGGMTL
ncbi:MAG: 3-oxoacyl-ACP reductase FabG [Clostridiales bacterium]|jgi:3-oxoacyl-[acyl-carrier protein] reductase|nr:3-oxoacyl-ACP reductase FabG [Clostridiales bacterium]